MNFQPKPIHIILFLLLALSGTSFSQTKDTIIDSRYSWAELQNKFVVYYTDSGKNKMTGYQIKTAIQWINEKTSLVNVVYFGFDNRLHAGQLICHRAVANDVRNIFNELLQMRFPVYQCKPISEFDFSDVKSMQANNTSGFDFRFKTGSHTLSKHSYGLAIDINPVQNPYKKGEDILPLNYNENTTAGRIRITDETGNKVIALFRKYGWSWGGSWRSLHDYMHFEKR